MSRRLIAAVLLGALTALGSALPGAGLAPRAAAASCSGWSSNTQPPPTIRVFRHATGAVEKVDFRAYTKNVLSREWISSWTTESLRSGALAVKNYAWYQVLHWRGGTNARGECFDVRDDTWDQVYDPARPTYSTAAAAVDATWAVLVHKNGAVFPTYYNAGESGEKCGANANGWKAYQWGTQACGQAGKTAAQIILTYYYPGVTVAGTQPTPPPTPVPTATPPPSPTPRPTPRPTAAPSGTPPAQTLTPAPTATPAASPYPTPATPTPATPTPVPSASPTPALPPPPPGQALPGGGQAGVEDSATPPPPPPDEPAPVVAEPGEEVPAPETGAAAALRWGAVLARLSRIDAEAATLYFSRRVASMHSPATSTDLRLVAFHAFWDDAVQELVAAVASRLAPTSVAIGPRH